MLKSNLKTLTEKVRQKQISSYEIVSFYCERIKKINSKIDALLQFDEEEALRKAKLADEDILKNKTLGPLHGIPFTAKDWLETKDFITTSGMDERKNYLPKYDATVISRLKDAGAILIGKTNVPYNGTGLDHPIYGKTKNPYDLSRTPGWSSGGEAALIAVGGTSFGIGSDSGGSIRVPCNFCGIAGLKPTTGRIPSTGHYPEIGGFLDPRSQIGPLARYVSDLKFLYPLLSGSDGIDPYVVDTASFPIPELSKLKVAYYIEHDNLSPSSEISNVIEDAVSYVRNSVLSVEYNQPKALSSVLDITDIYWSIYKESPNTKEYLNLLKKWDEFRKNMWIYMQSYDVIITPVCTETAIIRNTKEPKGLISYTLTYSLLGWPCAVVRIGTSKSGMPINIQVISKPFHEETCLLVAEFLEKMCGWIEPNLDY